MNISIKIPLRANIDEFLKRTCESKAFHSSWVMPPTTEEAYMSYLKKYNQKQNISYLVCLDKNIAGVINLNQIIRGPLKSAFLGYYAMQKYSQRGIMHAGMKLVLYETFTTHDLHRVEANIQPTNVNSINFIQKCGFRKEGFSPKYLYIDGKWRDHERWAIIKENIYLKSFVA